MDYFILNHTWFLLNYVFGFLGVYPCKKDGATGLKLTSACRFWMQAICIYLLAQFLMVLSIFNISYIESSFMEVAESFQKRFLKSKTTKYVLFASNILIHLLYFIVIFKVRELGKELVCIQDYFNIKGCVDQTELKKVARRVILNFIPYMMMVITSFILEYVSLFYQIGSDVELSTFGIVCCIACITMEVIIRLVPTWYFVCVYFEVAIVLLNWCKYMISKPDKLKIIQDTKNFIGFLKVIKKAFSPALFWIISLYVLTSILTSYVSISLLMEGEIISWEQQCLVISFLLTTFGLIYLVFRFCSTSEDLAINVQELKEWIMENLSGNVGEIDTITFHLQDFQGFDGNGFFTLNHSMVTAMTANIATYLVILVQFKQSE